MRVGWRTITVGAVFLAVLYGIAFVTQVSEGSNLAAAALNAAILMALAVAATAAVIGAAAWASKDGDRK